MGTQNRFRYNSSSRVTEVGPDNKVTLRLFLYSVGVQKPPTLYPYIYT